MPTSTLVHKESLTTMLGGGCQGGPGSGVILCPAREAMNTEI